MTSNLVSIKINPQTASKRTRKCIKSAGPDFEVVKKGQPDSIRVDSILVRSVSTGWFGWLPLTEVVVHAKTLAPSAT